MKFQKIIKCLTFNLPQFKKCLQEEEFIISPEFKETSNITDDKIKPFKSIIDDIDIYHDISTLDFKAPNEIVHVPQDFPKPMQKELPPIMISSHITSLKTDEAVQKFIKSSSLNKDRVTLIEFGASWCSHCHEIFPQFYKLTKQYPNYNFAVAQLDNLQEMGEHVNYTPTFSFYKDGKRIDEIFGNDVQKLHDRIWLHHN